MAKSKKIKSAKSNKKTTGSVTIGRQKKPKGATMTAEVKVGKSKRA